MSGPPTGVNLFIIRVVMRTVLRLKPLTFKLSYIHVLRKGGQGKAVNFHTFMITACMRVEDEDSHSEGISPR